MNPSRAKGNTSETFKKKSSSKGFRLRFTAIYVAAEEGSYNDSWAVWGAAGLQQNVPLDGHGTARFG